MLLTFNRSGVSQHVRADITGRRGRIDLENVPVATKNGTPVLLRDLGSVDFGPEVRRGAADWQGEGEAVSGIVVMRFGMNALNVISGVKAKLRTIAPSLPPGVEIVTGYDRSWLINESIKTLKRDLILEAIIVSFVSIAFLFHLRSALVSAVFVGVEAGVAIVLGARPAEESPRVAFPIAAGQRMAM